MSLFQSIVNSISNPQHTASGDDLQGLLNIANMIPGVRDKEQQIICHRRI
jgi:hypothetical protein